MESEFEEKKSKKIFGLSIFQQAQKSLKIWKSIKIGNLEQSLIEVTKHVKG